MEDTKKGTLIFREGEVLIREGEKDKTIYFLISGKIGVYKGGRLIGMIDKPNSPIGEISAILGSERTATCVAMERSEVVAYKGGIDEIIAKYPKTTKAIIKNLAERVATSTEKLSGASYASESTEIAKVKDINTDKGKIPSESKGGGKSEQHNADLSSYLMKIPDEYMMKVMKYFTEKELAIVLSRANSDVREKVKKFVSDRKMESIDDLIHHYSSKGISAAELHLIEEKLRDMLSAVQEEMEKAGKKGWR